MAQDQVKTQGEKETTNAEIMQKLDSIERRLNFILSTNTVRSDKLKLDPQSMIKQA